MSKKCGEQDSFCHATCLANYGLPKEAAAFALPALNSLQIRDGIVLASISRF
jgi:hypothetical protein